VCGQVVTVRDGGRAGDGGSAEPPHRMYMYKCRGVCSFLWRLRHREAEGWGAEGRRCTFFALEGGGGLCVCALALPLHRGERRGARGK
jgi:hypothetical protein